jgi:hypothetical protein
MQTVHETLPKKKKKSHHKKRAGGVSSQKKKMLFDFPELVTPWGEVKTGTLSDSG